MRVIVGTKATPTPMMAAMLRYVSLNPYWNVPPELTQSLVAKKVLSEGLQYLAERDYEVLSDWTDDAKAVDPSTVDWAGVAAGQVELRVRRGPGPWNSMGQMKFMLPNDLGIYLHDVPDKAHFADEDRWLSNGCVRLQDAQKLAKWIFGTLPQARTGRPEERVDLAAPIPVYITYLTVSPTSSGSLFRRDPYERDVQLLARVNRNQEMSEAEDIPVLAQAVREQRTSTPPKVQSETLAVRRGDSFVDAIELALASPAGDQQKRTVTVSASTKVPARTMPSASIPSKGKPTAALTSTRLASTASSKGSAGAKTQSSKVSTASKMASAGGDSKKAVPGSAKTPTKPAPPRSKLAGREPAKPISGKPRSASPPTAAKAANTSRRSTAKSAPTAT
jgi:hypothetical protein